jgi:hypothetical protein
VYVITGRFAVIGEMALSVLDWFAAPFTGHYEMGVYPAAPRMAKCSNNEVAVGDAQIRRAADVCEATLRVVMLTDGRALQERN